MSAVIAAMWRIGQKRKVNAMRSSERLGKECMAWNINIKYKKLAAIETKRKIEKGK